MRRACLCLFLISILMCLNAYADGGQIAFNEVMLENASTIILSDGTHPAWFELINQGEKDIYLNGYSVMRSEDPTTIALLPTVTVRPREVLLVICDGRTAFENGIAHIDLKLKHAGDSLTLLDPAGNLLDQIVIPSLKSDEAFARSAVGEWQTTLEATPGYGNEHAGVRSAMNDAADVVAITEVMADNRTWCLNPGGEAYDYVEITNTSAQTVDLTGWYLSDKQDKPLAWQFPSMQLPAGGSMLVFCSGEDTVDASGRLHTGFSISKHGEMVLLTRPDGVTVSRVSVPALGADQAYSLVGGVWTLDAPPSPGYANDWNGQMAALSSSTIPNSANVYINEVCATSTQAVANDWIELYNASAEAVDLSGWYLSNDSAKPRRWQFPDGTVLPAGGYAGVLCDGTDAVSASGIISTSFSLPISGGYTVALSRPDGTLADRMYIPVQRKGISYGRGANGLYYFEQPSPRAENPSSGYQAIAPSAQIDTHGGFYRAGDLITVSVTAPTGATVCYTLDGSEPTETAMRYTAPITIGDSTILRVRTFQSSCLPGELLTESYLYNVDNNGVRVVSLTATPEALFGAQGVISDYLQQHECAANMEVFEADGTRLMDQGCGLALHGADSRKEDQKGFNVIARSIYGSNRFHAKLIQSRPYTEYQSIVLRASGEDAAKTHMRDSVLTSLADSTSVMYQESEPCIVYVNGEYYGIYYIRDRLNAHGICQYEGWEGQEDQIDFVQGNSSVKQGSNKTFEELLKYVKSTDPNDPSFYNEVARVIDIQNYMEYIGLEMFVGNADTLNVKRYRNPNADGLWRWCLYDLDWGFYVDTNSINRWMNPEGMGVRKATDNTLFIALMNNDRFRDEFLTWFGEQLAGPFSSESVMARIDARQALLDPLMDAQLSRWGQTRADWLEEMQELRDYAAERPKKLMLYFQGKDTEKAYFSLTDAEMEHYFSKAREVALAYTGS